MNNRTVTKNSGRIETFDCAKIKTAIGNALVSTEDFQDSAVLRDIIDEVYALALKLLPESPQLHVSDVHDSVERAFMRAERFEAGRAYISRRDSKRQNKGRPIPPDVRAAFDSASEFFPTQLQQFQFYNKYSRFDHSKGRRETWPETVDRVVSYLAELAEDAGGLPSDVFETIRDKMLRLEVMPSMRLIAMAGPAARRNNISIYNCSYQGIDHPYAFVEALIISMCGCGVGFSVEKQFVDRLPAVRKSWEPEVVDYQTLYDEDNYLIDEYEVLEWNDDYLWGEDEEPVRSFGTRVDPEIAKEIHVVEDTSDGWAWAMWCGLAHWWQGSDSIEFDFSQVRPSGAILKTKGGTSSGPEPLRRMLDFIKKKLLSKRGQKLSTVDVYDIMCIIGDCVVQGGVRRSAMISGFDWDDHEMRNAKSGAWSEQNGQRSNANNSCVWPNRKLSDREVIQFVLDMDASGAGEPGIFSRMNAHRMMPKRRFEKLTGKELAEMFTNPCGEINLLHQEFCNLSIAVARPGMSMLDMMESVKVATIIGTIQSTAVNFPGLRKGWSENCKKERLLGVDITGQADVDYLTASNLSLLRQHAIQTNKLYAEKLKIPQSASVTCVKPSGNSSVFLNCAPGINRRWSDFQIRRTRLSANGVMAKVLLASGFELTPENGQTPNDVTTYVAAWPARTPQIGGPTTRQRCAIDQCEVWKNNKINWTEHNPSVTITYHPDELVDIIYWIRENQEIIGGMAFLPASESTYQQMPNEEISEEEYQAMVNKIPKVDWAMLYAFEEFDTTTSAQELACVGGACALDF